MSFRKWTFVFMVSFVARAAMGLETAPRLGAADPPSRAYLAQVSDTDSRASLEELLARSAGLSRSGRNAEAYELLAAAEDTYIGTIEFDYALGRTALDAGYPDKATLAFDRVLALEPSHAGARIDMGRAYLALGDFRRARRIFQSLLARDPPPEIRVQLQAFLDLAEGRATRPGRSGALLHHGYVATLFGRSSNVNQSPTQSSFFFPLFGANFELAGQNLKKPDSFAGIAGGIDYSQQLDGAFAFTFGGEFQQRRNFHEFDFDIAGVNFYVGLTAALGPNAWNVQRLVGRDYLGRSPSRDLDALSLNYVRQIDSAMQLLALAQGGRLRHVRLDQRPLDANYATWGGGIAHKLGEDSTGFVILSTGNQNDVGDNPDGGRHLLGARAGGEWGLGERTRVSVAVSGERSAYDTLNTGFQVERRDIRRAYEASAQYALDRSLSLRFSFLHAYQRSNIPIYEYSRSEWALALRREFR